MLSDGEGDTALKKFSDRGRIGLRKIRVIFKSKVHKKVFRAVSSTVTLKWRCIIKNETTRKKNWHYGCD